MWSHRDAISSSCDKDCSYLSGMGEGDIYAREMFTLLLGRQGERAESFSYVCFFSIAFRSK